MKARRLTDVVQVEMTIPTASATLARTATLRNWVDSPGEDRFQDQRTRLRHI